MNTGIFEALQRVCKILNECEVEYLTIGGAAVALHGHERMSKNTAGKETEVVDVDIWYNPTYKNYFKVLNALEKLDLDVAAYRSEKAPDPNRSFFRLNRDLFTLDLLPSAPGMPRFREAFNVKETEDLEGIIIPYLDLDHLIKNKQALDRLKDREDIRHLQSIKKGLKPRQRRPGQTPS